MVVDLVLQRADIHGVLGELCAQLLHLRRVSPDRTPSFVRLLDHLGELLLQLRLVGGLVQAEGLLHLRQQVPVEELGHLAALLACMMR